MASSQSTERTPHDLLSHEFHYSSSCNRHEKFCMFKKQLDIFFGLELLQATENKNHQRLREYSLDFVQRQLKSLSYCHQRKLWFKSVHSFVYLTGTFQVKSTGVMTIFRHYGNARSSNFLLTFNTIPTIFRIRYKKTCAQQRDKEKLGFHIWIIQKTDLLVIIYITPDFHENLYITHKSL